MAKNEPGNASAKKVRFPRPPIVEKGPTADEVQPPKRRDPSLVFHEDIVSIFDEPRGTGWEKCVRGVNLEIVRVLGDMFQSEHDTSSRIFLLFLDPRTRKPLTYDFFDPKTRKAEKRLKWYVCNQTAKKALAAAFGTKRIVNWVGWVRLGVREVENKLQGRGVMVPAIRFANVLPDLEPTFDYAACIQERLAKLGAPTSEDRPPAAPPPPSEGELSEEERAAIAAEEREQFTEDPDEGDTGS